MSELVTAPIQIVRKSTFTLEQVTVALMHDGWPINATPASIYVDDNGNLVLKFYGTDHYVRKRDEDLIK